MYENELDDLTCPYCRGALVIAHRLDTGVDGELLAGTVRCPCYEYPVLDGILVLRQTSDAASVDDVASAALRSGDITAARSHLMRRGSMVAMSDGRRRRGLHELVRGTARRVVRRSGESSSAGAGPGTREWGRTALWDDLVRWRPPLFREYLYLRYANPSFVASVPLMMRLEGIDQGSGPSTILDIGCGIGHSTAMLRLLYPEATIVAADPDFVNLVLLRRHFVSDARCVCVDAELPLPFGRDAFDGAVCLDAFHYIRSKWALAHELDRVVGGDGIWVVPHLHNAVAENVHAGIPLGADDYRRLFAFAPTALLDEGRVLQQFLGAGVVDVGIDEAPSPSTPVFSMVGSRRADVWGERDAAGRLAATGLDGLGLNPVYRILEEGSVLQLGMVWPDEGMAHECAAIERFLPTSLELDRDFVERVRRGETSPDERPAVDELVRSFVLVHLPAGYRRFVDPPAGGRALPLRRRPELSR